MVLQKHIKHLREGIEYKAVFFDFGGTIAFNNDPFPNSLHKILGSIGIDVDIKQLRSVILDADCHCDELSEERKKSRERTRYRNFRIKFYKHVLNSIGFTHMEKHAEYIQNVINYYHGTYLKPETFYVLDTLKQAGYKTGIVSNISHIMPYLCDELGLTEKVDFITYSDDVGYEKPMPQIFEDALAKADVNPNNTIHVGDSYEADVLGARALGITPVLILNDNYEEEYEDCICIYNLMHILDILGIKHKYALELI